MHFGIAQWGSLQRVHIQATLIFFNGKNPLPCIRRFCEPAFEMKSTFRGCRESDFNKEQHRNFYESAVELCAHHCRTGQTEPDHYQVRSQFQIFRSFLGTNKNLLGWAEISINHRGAKMTKTFPKIEKIKASHLIQTQILQTK